MDSNGNFIIPSNFTDSGKFLGMFELRNLIESVILVGTLGLLEYALISVPFLQLLFIMVVTLAPILIISIIGIKGDSVTQFFLTMFNFMKNKRKLRFRRIMIDENTNQGKAKIQNSAKSRTASKKKSGL